MLIHVYYWLCSYDENHHIFFMNTIMLTVSLKDKGFNNRIIYLKSKMPDFIVDTSYNQLSPACNSSIMQIFLYRPTFSWKIICSIAWHILQCVLIRTVPPYTVNGRRSTFPPVAYTFNKFKYYCYWGLGLFSVVNE